MSRTCDVMCAADHVVRFTRPSPSVFAYSKWSKTGAGEGLGTRLFNHLFPHLFICCLPNITISPMLHCSQSKTNGLEKVYYPLAYFFSPLAPQRGGGCIFESCDISLKNMLTTHAVSLALVLCRSSDSAKGHHFWYCWQFSVRRSVGSLMSGCG